MDPTISVSKGCFVFKNGATRAGKKSTAGGNKRKHSTSSGNSALGSEFTEQPFYKAYAHLWYDMEEHINKLQEHNYASTLGELVAYIASKCNEQVSEGVDIDDMDEILPAAALLTGINQPDHLEQFHTLTQHLLKRLSAIVCILQSRDSSTLKSAVETMVFNFMENSQQSTKSAAELEDEEEEERAQKRVRRSQCTIRQLRRWYNEKFAQNDSDSQQRPPLILILPDFECFNAVVLQNFILILSAHRAELPFVIIFGVATSVSAVHGTLPYHVSSKIRLRVFQTQPAPVCLNDLIERVILSPQFPFHLSGKVFKFLTHIFLYYDFSIHGFIQGFKYCLMEHFFQGNAYALCSQYASSLQRIKSLTHDDIEAIRHLLSFRPYVEQINDCKRVIAILTDDNYLKKKLPQLLRDCHVHFALFRIFLVLLTSLVGDLPKCPLGKQCRELYSLCLAKDITAQAEFKECWQMLAFMSKQELIEKVTKALNATSQYLELLTNNNQLELLDDCAPIVQQQLNTIKSLLHKVNTASHEAKQPSTSANTEAKQQPQFASRQDLKEHLLQMSKQQKPSTELSEAINALLMHIKTEIIERYLVPLERAPPLHELFVYSDVNTVRRHIIGAPRAALHMALNNPHYYLQCKCCELNESAQLLPSMPDLSVVYKLHLECGRMINLYDWLQAFRAVVDDNEEEQPEQVDAQIQARFTRAVAELQFLGYIKMSKRKTDHATRLTW